MSDDTLNAGSDEELPVDETIGTDDAASQETTEESNTEVEPKGKEKALRDTDAALKARQAEFTRLSQELAHMKGQLTTLTALQAQPKQEEQKDWMDAVDDEKIMASPKEFMRQLREKTRDEIRAELASVLRDRDAYLLSRVGSQSLDPKLHSIVEGLRNDADFADLPDEKLVAIAKKMNVGSGSKAVMQPRGNIAGTQRAAPVAAKKDGEFSAEETAWLRAAGVLKSNKRDDTLE